MAAAQSSLALFYDKFLLHDYLHFTYMDIRMFIHVIVLGYPLPIHDFSLAGVLVV